jgi:hypothetical protein
MIRAVRLMGLHDFVLQMAQLLPVSLCCTGPHVVHATAPRPAKRLKMDLVQPGMRNVHACPPGTLLSCERTASLCIIDPDKVVCVSQTHGVCARAREHTENKFAGHHDARNATAEQKLLTLGDSLPDETWTQQESLLGHHGRTQLTAVAPSLKGNGLVLLGRLCCELATRIDLQLGLTGCSQKAICPRSLCHCTSKAS